MRLSKFGESFARSSGARELMDDLGAAMSSETPVMMLGGGNPAHIPEVLDLLRSRLHEVADDPRELRRMLADYAAPAGELRFRQALARLLRNEYGWPLTERNIVLTGGSQAGFFQLFNLLAGSDSAGERRRILLPLVPEYAGYMDLGIEPDMFVAVKPEIEYLDDRLFKYHVDFDRIHIDDSIAAICVSRPTNPTGNVLTDQEMRQLAGMANDADVPLIVDSAYGMPFPQIVFGDATPFWNESVILCMSLSKLGLPAVRTGIVIASEPIADAMTSVNAVLSLAVSSVGPSLMRNMVESGEIMRLSRDVIRPYYASRAAQALAWVHESLAGCAYHVHRPEGALFLWLWFPDLPISSQVLYERLKARGVYVLPGHHFFPGLDEAWDHRHQCIRITYAREADSVRDGIALIGEEVRRAG